MVKTKKILIILLFLIAFFNVFNNLAFCEESKDHTETAQISQENSYPVFNKTDEKTGVCVIAASGVYPADAELKVTEFKPGSSEYNEVISGLDKEKAKDVQRLSIYNIEVLKDGKDIELSDNQLAIVRIPVPHDFDKNEIEALSIIYGDNNDINIDGAITEVEGKSYFEFTTNNLNQFKNITIIDKKSIFMTVFIFIIIIIITAVIIILSIKNKKASK